MSLSPSRLIEVKWTPGKGRGVFACERIPKGTIIERVPIVTIPYREIFGWTKSSKLSEYVFKFDPESVAISLGYGSLYNHSYRPNAEYFFSGRLAQVFSAIRNISRGEEITINYNGDPRNRSPVKFQVS